MKKITAIQVVTNICFAGIEFGRETTSPNAMAPRRPPYERIAKKEKRHFGHFNIISVIMLRGTDLINF